ncbi:MAG: bifunctional glutamate N-acetyltransferase/amino-acid acetyltransferase ArgJ [Spirochaetales bacterium]|nr:bifunctional glutamate N-acetyltransferase/amino-acid acetyltransferase ArgJ [Spirochaetales bacterium]
MIEVKNHMILPEGFSLSGVHAGIKKVKLDMGIIKSDVPCTSGSAYTTNRVKAAPVVYDMEIKGTPKLGVVMNSGNANACTGEKGYEDTRAMAAKAAELLGGEAADYFVASTGVIGVPLPMDKIIAGIESAASTLGRDEEHMNACSDSVLTTDTHRKCVSAQFETGGKKVTVTGFSKGSGMIHPNMATTLSFIMTDAAVSTEVLQKLVGESVDDTFNMISVDGDTSTNDSCFVLANGMSGAECSSGEAYIWFASALKEVLRGLAKMLVKDGEGAEKFIEVRVNGAKDNVNAKILARSIISSNLVKAAFFGSDANWGRILCAMGYSGAEFDPSSVDLYFTSAAGKIQTLKAGEPLAFDEELAKKILLEKEVGVLAELSDGSASAEAWGCDLTYEYVRINGDYRS